MIRIRPARMEDAEGLATVHVRSWQAAYVGLIPQRYLDQLSVARRLELWKRVLAATARPSTGTLVAELDGKVVAFVHTSPSRDEDQDPAAVGELTSIYALPEVWGRGIGRSLMSSAIAGLTDAGFSSATLWVLDTNRRARRFYEVGPWRPDGAARTDDRGEFVLQEVRYRCRLPPARFSPVPVAATPSATRDAPILLAMAPTPYLHFHGTAGEALSFYAGVFGGRAQLHTFAEFNRSGPAQAVAHGYLVDGPVELFAADVAEEEPAFQARGLMLSLLGAADAATLRRWFTELAQGGTVVDALQQRPHGASDGQVVDRYGVHWLIGFEDDAPAVSG